MDPDIPLHIQRLVQELNSGVPPAEALLALSPYIVKDPTLYRIFLSLSFSFITHSFPSLFSCSEVLELLANEYNAHCSSASGQMKQELLRTFYGHQLHLIASGSQLGLEPELLTPLKGHAPKDSTETPPSLLFTEDAPKSIRGLKQLTGFVKHTVCKHSATSFKEVAERLIEQLVEPDADERIKEEKNVRRRVYDAINVLIAAGVIERCGRTVSWNEGWDYLEIDRKRKEIEEKRGILSAKRRELAGVLKKFLATKQLLDRNSENGGSGPTVHFPFIIVSTEDTPDNNMTIRFSRDMRDLQVKCGKSLHMYGDMDILLALQMDKLSNSLLKKYIPTPELIKYCPGQSN